jgi:hypothetical protein
MKKWIQILCIGVALWPQDVAAQPLFRYEHDFSFTLADRRFGVREAVQSPGEWRTTQVWVGGRCITTRLPWYLVVAAFLGASAAWIAALIYAVQQAVARGARSRARRGESPVED